MRVTYVTDAQMDVLEEEAMQRRRPGSSWNRNCDLGVLEKLGGGGASNALGRSR